MGNSDSKVRNKKQQPQQQKGARKKNEKSKGDPPKASKKDSDDEWYFPDGQCVGRTKSFKEEEQQQEENNYEGEEGVEEELLPTYFPEDEEAESKALTKKKEGESKEEEGEKKAKKKKKNEKKEQDEPQYEMKLSKEMDEQDIIDVNSLKLETLEDDSGPEQENSANDNNNVTEGAGSEAVDEDDDEEEEEVAKNPSGEIVFQLTKFPKQRNVKKSRVIVTGDVAWRVSVFPPYSKGRCISIYIDVVELRRRRATRNVRTCFTLSLLNLKDPDQNCFHRCEHVFSEAGDWGFNGFAAADKVLDPTNGYLDNGGTLVVTATLEQLPPVEDNGIDWMTYDSREATGYVGLQNQGATCYMNSLLQTLYHTSAFAQAVFEMQTEEEEEEDADGKAMAIAEKSRKESIPLALQELFFNLRFAAEAPSTRALTRSFGWDREDAFTQHDVQELDRVLLDNLESKMVGTPLEGTIKRIFAGRLRHSIRCTEVEYESAREEVFYDLSLDVHGFRTLAESFAAYTAVEKLDGDNKYMAESFGLQDAEKTCKLLALPPVLHIQLKRWEFDPNTLAQKKVNDYFEFPDRLDLTPYLDPNAPRDEVHAYRLHAVLIHSGDINGGHYFVYIRPTQAAKWFKFNDEIVIQTDLKHVFEAGFGGESEYVTNTAGEKESFGIKFSNACK